MPSENARSGTGVDYGVVGQTPNVLRGRERGKKGWEAFARPDNGGWQGGRSCAGARGAPLKSLDSDENFSMVRPKKCQITRKSIKKSVRISQGSGTFLGRTSQKNHPVYIVHLAELNLQICNYAQKRRICKYALDENFHGHFCPRRKAAKFCHPGSC